MKKTIIIISVVLGILAILVGVYFAWRKTKAILTPPGPSAQTSSIPSVSFSPSTATTIPALKLKILSDQPIFDYWVFSSTPTSTVATSTNKIFYLSQDGKIFELKEDAKSEAVALDPIENIQTVKSSSDGKRIIIKYGDIISPQFIIFNSETKIFEVLPGNIAAAAFSPDAKKIAYLDKTSGNLTIKDLVGAKPQTVKILTISQKDFDLEWTLPEKIILTPKPSAFYPASTWSIDIKKKTITPLGTEANGLIINWAAGGKMGLKFSSRLEGRGGSLYLINEQGLNQAELVGIMTLPEKCFVSELQIYCGFPNNISNNTVLPDDYLKRQVYFRDSFFQIDVAKNSISEIFDGLDKNIDAINLKLVNNKLFFINRYDNMLYQLEL